MNEDLISLSPPEKQYFLHRQLKYMDKNILYRKTSYTVKDLWAYFILSLRYQETVPNTLHISKEDLDRQRDKILDDENSFKADEIDFILAITKSFGVDVVLYAVEEAIPDDLKDKKRPSILEIERYLTIAQTNVKRLILEDKVSK